MLRGVGQIGQMVVIQVLTHEKLFIIADGAWFWSCRPLENCWLPAWKRCKISNWSRARCPPSNPEFTSWKGTWENRTIIRGMYICMFLLHSNHQMEYVVHIQGRRNRLGKGVNRPPPYLSQTFSFKWVWITTYSSTPPLFSDLPTALSYCNCSETNTSS